jgi:hypothetical protein
LHINDATGISRIRLTGGAAGADNFEIGQGVLGVTNEGFSIYDVDATANRLVIDGSGRVGIGTTDAYGRINVQRDSSNQFSTVSIGDFANADNSVGIYGRVGSSGLFGISTAGAPIVFYNGGSGTSEKARLDSSGRLLVGTSTAGGTELIQVQGVSGSSTAPGGIALRRSSISNTDDIGFIAFTNASGNSHAQIKAFCDGTPGTNDYPGALVFSTTADGASSPTERMRIRNNGIIRHYVYDEWMRSDTTTSCGYIGRGDQVISGGSTDNFGISTAGGDLLFGAGGTTEAMRITSSQEVLIGGTVDIGPYALQVKSTGVWGAGAYVNGSDRSIKEDIEPLTSSIEIVKQLNPVSFRYKEDFSKDTTLQPGFVAQDLQQAFAGQPYLDGIVQAGPEFLSVAYQSLIPILTKALQEAVTKIETLEAKVAVLEAS